MEDPVEVELVRMTLHPNKDQHLFLRVVGEDRTFRIVIGPYEAYEIRRKVCDEPIERPMPHDLIGRILTTTQHKLDRVVITELRGNTFFACLFLRSASLEDDGAHEKIVDCRPSDGIALAMQSQAKIFVSRQVLDTV